MSAEQRIKELGLSLPSGSAPAANYANAVRSGNLLFISGKAPLPESGKLPKGRLGREFSTEDDYRFARSAALDLVAVMKTELGSLDQVARVVEVQGIHARSVLGAGSLRGGLPVKDTGGPSAMVHADLAIIGHSVCR